MDDNRWLPQRRSATETLRRPCQVDDLRRTAEWGAEEVGPVASAEQGLDWTVRVFDDRFVVASSIQDGVLVHLASRASPGVDVVFLDTGSHFVETLGTRDAVESTYPVRLVHARGRATVAEQDAAEGKDLFARDRDRCCLLRKVEPLRRVLASYHAWVTGVRRVKAPTRAHTPLITFDAHHRLVKINPLGMDGRATGRLHR
jgi:phosphoadenosine phosphosulfate reductase